MLAIVLLAPPVAVADVALVPTDRQIKQGGVASFSADVSSTGPCRLRTNLKSEAKRKSYDLSTVYGPNKINFQVRRRSLRGRWRLGLICEEDRAFTRIRIKGHRAESGQALLLRKTLGVEYVAEHGNLDESVIPPEAELPPPDSGGPDPAFRIPFPCGEVWRASTYAGHGNAIDWNLPNSDDGGRPVAASAAGTVTYTAPLGQWNGGYGNYVIVNHGGGWTSLYAHLRGYNVSQGNGVTGGGIVGFVGTTGNSSGNHLHFEQRLNGSAQIVRYSGGQVFPGQNYQSDNCGAPPPPTIYRDVGVPGDWDGNGSTTPGVFRRSAPSSLEAKWLLRNSHGSVNPVDIDFNYGNWFTDQTVIGDWDGDGDQTVGVARKDPNSLNKVWYLRNIHAGGAVDITVSFGHYMDIPVVGDWDGDGDETIGVFKPAQSGGQEAVWALNNTNDNDGTPDITVNYGGFGDEPAVGDWDGDGDTTIGVFRPAPTSGAESRWILRNANSNGPPAYDFLYGGYQELQVRGDWDGDGDTTIGIFRPAPSPGLGAGWILRNSLSSGAADLVYSYGGASY